MKKDDRVIIRVDPETKEGLQKKAESLGLTVSSYIRMVLKKEIQKKS